MELIILGVIIVVVRAIIKDGKSESSNSSVVYDTFADGWGSNYKQNEISSFIGNHEFAESKISYKNHSVFSHDFAVPYQFGDDMVSPASEYSSEIKDIITDIEYFWHPDNIYHDSMCSAFDDSYKFGNDCGGICSGSGFNSW